MVESDDSFLKSAVIVESISAFFNPEYTFVNVSDKIMNQKANALYENNGMPDFLTGFNKLYSHFMPMKETKYKEITLSFSLFGKSCFSLCGEPRSKARITYNVSTDHQQFYGMNFFLGLLLYSFARFLSNRLVFYYVSGISVGIFFSVLFVTTFVFNLFMPRKSSFVIASSLQSLCLYYFDFWKKKYRQLLENNIEYVFGYLAFVAVFSFAATHYFLRTEKGVNVSSGLKDIVRVLIRCLGLLLLYNSTSSVSRSLLLVLSVVVYNFIGHSMVLAITSNTFSFEKNSKLKDKYLYRDRWLTKEEYEDQGVIETNKELKKLFKSGEFKDWMMKNTNRIKITRND